MNTATATQNRIHLSREELRTLLEHLIRCLVPQPDSIKVSFVQGENTTLFNVECPKECIGHLIGVKGRNITSLRTLMLAISAPQGFRSVIEIPFYEN